jgi:hypothetical protein
VSSLNRTLRILLALSIFLTAPASRLHAQAKSGPPSLPTATEPGADYENRWDIYGGFAYSHFNTGVGHSAHSNLLGGEGTATAWLSQVVGLSASAHYLTGTIPVATNAAGITNPRMNETLFLFGPEFRLYRSPKYALGLHVLIGGTYGIFDTDLKGVDPNSLNVYSNQLAFASAAGATWDYNLSRRLSVRGITDWQATRFGFNTQNEFAGSVGIVYKIGSLHTQK